MSAPIPLVRAAALHIATDFLRQHGVAVERLLQRVRLSPCVLEDPEAFVPFAAVTRLLEEAARLEGTEDLGLRIGRASNTQQLGTFGRLIGQSLTLGEALGTAYRVWASFNTGVRAWLTRSGHQVHLHHQFQGAESSWRQFAAANLMQYLNFLGGIGGVGWRPVAVQLPIPSLPGLRDVPVLADTRIQFGQPLTRITFSAAMLHEPMPRPAPARPPAPGATWEQPKPANDVGGAVREIVTTLLPDGQPSLRLVSAAAMMSARTLQRRLRDEGLSFARVVAQARLDAAQRMLDDPRRKVIDVAFDLGYSDPAHFTRAFERWTGLAPREFRRRRLADGPEAATGGHLKLAR